MDYKERIKLLRREFATSENLLIYRKGNRLEPLATADIAYLWGAEQDDAEKTIEEAIEKQDLHCMIADEKRLLALKPFIPKIIDDDIPELLTY